MMIQAMLVRLVSPSSPPPPDAFFSRPPVPDARRHRRNSDKNNTHVLIDIAAQETVINTQIGW